jgi:hypothetical protein
MEEEHNVEGFLFGHERERRAQLLRLSAILSLFLGALSTSQFYRKPYGVTGSLIAAATLKGLIATMWRF